MCASTNIICEFMFLVWRSLPVQSESLSRPTSVCLKSCIPLFAVWAPLIKKKWLSHTHIIGAPPNWALLPLFRTKTCGRMETPTPPSLAALQLVAIRAHPVMMTVTLGHGAGEVWKQSRGLLLAKPWSSSYRYARLLLACNLKIRDLSSPRWDAPFFF